MNMPEPAPPMRVASQVKLSLAPALTVEPISFSSGVPNRYRVLGLPDGQTAEIFLKRTGSTETWKIRMGQARRYRGRYGSEEEALSAIVGNY